MNSESSVKEDDDRKLTECNLDKGELISGTWNSCGRTKTWEITIFNIEEKKVDKSIYKLGNLRE